MGILLRELPGWGYFENLLGFTSQFRHTIAYGGYRPAAFVHTLRNVGNWLILFLPSYLLVAVLFRCYLWRTKKFQKQNTCKDLNANSCWFLRMCFTKMLPKPRSKPQNAKLGKCKWRIRLTVLCFFLVVQVKKLIVLDPKKRLTTLQALQHPWVTGKAANFAHMDNAQKKLQEFNARRKLKASLWTESLFWLWKHAIKLVALQKPCTLFRTTLHSGMEAFYLRWLMKMQKLKLA